MKSTIIMVSSVLVAAIAAAQTAPILTLDDAVALALKGNRQIQSTALDVHRSRQETEVAKTNRLPQFQFYMLGGEALLPIEFTIPRGALGFYSATGPIPRKDSNVTTPQNFTALITAQASQPLSQLWKIHLSLISAGLGESLAREKLRQQRQDTAQSVRDLYYQIAQTQSQIESAVAIENYLVELQGETDRNLVEFNALKGDSLTVRARLSQQRYQLLGLRDTIQTQEESLNRFLGRDLETEFSVEVPLPGSEKAGPRPGSRSAMPSLPGIASAISIRPWRPQCFSPHF